MEHQGDRISLGSSDMNILFAHALLGCDTTSKVHGVGKGVALKKISEDANFLRSASVFMQEDAGEKALVCVYNGKPNENLDSMRHNRYCQKVATGTIRLQPESVQQTSAAAAHHSLRVFYQVKQWKGDSALSPHNWGWELSKGRLVPVRTSLPPAHASLLEMVRCKCKTDCSTRRCTCKNNGLHCSAACGECKGQSCRN